MKTTKFSFSVNLPSVDDFAERFPQYGNFARGDGRFLYGGIVTPEGFNNARVATLVFEFPAVAGVAKLCYEAVQKEDSVEWRGFVKQFIGAVVCKLMEDNGFKKTGIKKSVRHPEFTKGEFYQQID